MNQIPKPKKGYQIIKGLFGKYEEIPETWQMFNLTDTDIIKLSSGKSIEIQEKGQYPIYGSNGIIGFANKYNEEDCILIGRVGAAGSICSLTRKAWITDNVLIAKLGKKLEKKFADYMLVNLNLKQFATITAQPLLTQSILKRLKLVTPPIPEQQKIASILSNVDVLIGSTQKVIEKTESVKKALTQNLLTRGIGHKKFKLVKGMCGKVEEIPEEWTICLLEKLSSVRKERHIDSNLYVGLEHISQGTNILMNKGNNSQFSSTKNVFKKGDVLYGKLRPLLNKAWLSTEDGYCSTDILPIQTNEKLNNVILLRTLSSDDFVRYAASTSAGIKMPRTNWTDMKKYIIKLPQKNEQQKIASILSTADSHVGSQIQYKIKLESLKKGLMQKLLTGQIRVPLS